MYTKAAVAFVEISITFHELQLKGYTCFCDDVAFVALLLPLILTAENHPLLIPDSLEATDAIRLIPYFLQIVEGLRNRFAMFFCRLTEKFNKKYK